MLHARPPRLHSACLFGGDDAWPRRRGVMTVHGGLGGACVCRFGPLCKDDQTGRHAPCVTRALRQCLVEGRRGHVLLGHLRRRRRPPELCRDIAANGPHSRGCPVRNVHRLVSYGTVYGA